MANTSLLTWWSAAPTFARRVLVIGASLARHRADKWTVVLMAPGWVQTELGGPDARLSIQDSIRDVVKTIETPADSPGLHDVDYRGQTVPW